MPYLNCPGSVDRQVVPINKFNAEVLIPELRAAKKTTESYICWAGALLLCRQWCATTERPAHAGG